MSVSQVALKSFAGHLWYLSETIVGLAFFDPSVADETKSEMIAALQNKGHEKPARRVKVEIPHISTTKLSDFVSVNTRKLFAALGIEQGFLQTNPNTWKTNKQFLEGHNKIKCLKVVNDAAERGVALIQNFNAAITNNEEQKQYLLQVVELHRTLYPNSNKSTIVK